MAPEVSQYTGNGKEPVVMRSHQWRLIGRAVAIALLGATMVLIPAIASTTTQTSVARTLPVWMDGWSSGSVTNGPATINWQSAAAVAEALAAVQKPKKDKKPPKP
jgi:hypothetical protein